MTSQSTKNRISFHPSLLKYLYPPSWAKSHSRTSRMYWPDWQTHAIITAKEEFVDGAELKSVFWVLLNELPSVLIRTSGCCCAGTWGRNLPLQGNTLFTVNGKGFPWTSRLIRVSILGVLISHVDKWFGTWKLNSINRCCLGGRFMHFWKIIKSLGIF